MLSLLSRRLVPRVTSLTPRFRLLTQSTKTVLIHEIRAQKTENTIDVTWKDGTTDRFPFVYLRDCCQCPSCRDPVNHLRQFDVMSICDLDHNDTQLTVPEASDQLHIIWPDGHVSTFNADWLKKRRFPEKKEAASSIIPDRVQLWESGQEEEIPRMRFDDVLTDDNVLYKWMDLLQVYGAVLVENAPKQFGQVTRLAERVAGYLHSTPQGSTIDLRVLPKDTGFGYSDEPVLLHVDHSFLYNNSEVIMFHCIMQASRGGDSLYVDGFNVAEKLYQMDPKAFKLLTTSYIPHFFRDKLEYNPGRNISHAIKCPIKLDHFGKLQQFTYSDHTRGSEYYMTLKEAQDFYDAYFKLTKLIRDPTNSIVMKLRPGDIFVVDNQRVMHGRKGFDSNKEERQLELAYVEWDGIHSTRRLLMKDLGITGKQI